MKDLNKIGKDIEKSLAKSYPEEWKNLRKSFPKKIPGLLEHLNGGSK